MLAHNTLISQHWVNWNPDTPPPPESVQALAARLSAQADTREAAARAVHDWVCQHICYDWDAYYSERYSTLRAEDVLREGYSVCEGIANLVQALYLAMDIPCVKVWGVCVPEGQGWDEKTASSQRVNHTWNECYMDGRWIAVDCTMDTENSYIEGRRVYALCADRYFDPDPAFFAQTHKILQRGADLPENIPADWALGEIQQAVDLTLVPLSTLSRYQEPVTSTQFLDLLGLPGQGSDGPLTRAEAALLLDSGLESQETGRPFLYEDMDGCTPQERSAAASLFRRGIMAGTGRHTFSPSQFITRQETIVIALRLFEEGAPCT